MQRTPLRGPKRVKYPKCSSSRPVFALDIVPVYCEDRRSVECANLSHSAPFCFAASALHSYSKPGGVQTCCFDESTLWIIFQPLFDARLQCSPK